MSSSPRGPKFWISAWLPVGIGVGVILLESTEWLGANHTNGPLRTLWQALFGPVSNLRWNFIHMIIRKSGHFVGYGLVSMAWLRAWWMTLPHSHFIEDTFLALLGTSLVASLDELHQSYIPNRTGSPWDVLLDCAGAISLQILLYLYLRIMRPRRLARSVSGVNL